MDPHPPIMADRTVFVTGGASGIGETTVLEFVPQAAAYWNDRLSIDLRSATAEPWF